LWGVIIPRGEEVKKNAGPGGKGKENRTLQRRKGENRERGRGRNERNEQQIQSFVTLSRGKKKVPPKDQVRKKGEGKGTKWEKKRKKRKKGWKGCGGGGGAP